MTFQFAVPRDGCIHLLTSLETVFSTSHAEIEIGDSTEPPTITLTVEPPFSSLFLDWAEAKQIEVEVI